MLIATLTLISIQSQAFSATSEVTWTDYEKYRDIDSGDQSRKHFRERTFKEFEEYFAELAARLPEGQVLKIDVTDVDLAGDTNAGGIHRLRIVKDIFFPRINFSYQLVNADGSVAKEDTVVVKDMNFMMGSNLKYRNKSLGYEKSMLNGWFLETFSDLLADNK